MSKNTRLEDLEAPTISQIRSELQKEQKKSNHGRVIRTTVFSMLVVAAASALIAILLLPVLQISGTSMSDTLQDGDVVVALKGSSYKAGDIIAFYYNNNILVKRVIATAGDWVNIDEEGNVYVNDEKLIEPYIDQKALGECNISLPYQVPDGRNFVMGDQRDTSIDSRNTAVGCVSNDLVIGKLMARIWPLSEASLLQ